MKLLMMMVNIDTTSTSTIMHLFSKLTRSKLYIFISFKVLAILMQLVKLKSFFKIICIDPCPASFHVSFTFAFYKFFVCSPKLLHRIVLLWVWLKKILVFTYLWIHGNVQYRIPTNWGFCCHKWNDHNCWCYITAIK